MTPTLVQHKFAQVFGQAATTLTFTNVSAPGNAVVVGLITYDGGTTVNITDTQGNVYTQGATYALSANATMYIYYASNIRGEGAPIGVVIDPSGASADITVSIAEFSGVLRVSPGDGGNSANGNSTSPSVSQSSTAAGDLVIGLLSHNDTNRTLTETGSASLIDEQEGGTSNMPLSLTYRVAGAAGSQSATWTIGTGAVAWGALVLNLKAQDYPAESQGDPMFINGYPSDFGWSVQNHTSRPAAAMGVAVTPGNNSKGTAAQLFTALANDVYEFEVCINNASVSATSRNIIVDILYDPAGGTSWTTLIANLGGACASTMDSLGGIWYKFKVFIRAGSTVAAKASCNGSTTGLRVWMRCYGRPRNPELYKVASYTESIGVTTASSSGTSITAGTTSDGSWTLIGTTTKDLWWWQAALFVDDTTMSAVNYTLDVAVGSNGEMPLITDQMWRSDASERLGNMLISCGCERFVPAGTNIYARLQCSGTPDSNLSVAVYGAGG